MNGRFGPAIVAFALATAFVANARVLPELFVQLHDRNLLGGPVYAGLLHAFGYAFVSGLCAVLAGAAVLLVAWRTRVRGATDWHAALAAALVALCLLGRMGVSLDPIGWTCFAAVCLLAERSERWSLAAAVAVVALWSCMQGGALAGAIVLLAAACFDVRKAPAAIAAAVLAALQLHGAPWQAYGAHVVYLDSLWPGAQRDRIWHGAVTTQTLAFCAIFILAGWYGLRRRARAADAPVFFAFFLLALVDARNLPYFGIAAAPIVADSVASYYLNARSSPLTSLRSHAFTFAAAVCAFVATLVVTEPRVTVWPQAPGSAALLLAGVAAGDRPHRVLCVQPRWCDGIAASEPRLSAVLDDRAGTASRSARRTEADVDAQQGPWRSELRRSKTDLIVAGRNDGVVSLLTSTGWRVGARDAQRVVLLREDAR